MLIRAHRLVTSRDFADTVRRGRRAGSLTLVLHHLVGARDPAATGPARIGLVVAKTVGPAVTRNLVKRRLRHIARERCASLPVSSTLVVRALPAAAAAPYARLERDFDGALDRLRSTQ